MSVTIVTDALAVIDFTGPVLQSILAKLLKIRSESKAAADVGDRKTRIKKTIKVHKYVIT